MTQPLAELLLDLTPRSAIETAAEAAVDARDLAKEILHSEWLAELKAEVVRAAAEKAWDQALLTAADKLPAPLQLAGEFLRGMVAGGANPYRADG